MKEDLFDEYRQHSDPKVRQLAADWGMSIGLQDVDGLSVSPYLIELAKRNIEGEITIDEVRELIAGYYRKNHESEPPSESAEYYGYTI